MIFDTFYLLFKSNSDDLIKGNKAAEKSTNELGDKLKKTGDEAVGLGKEYKNIMDGVIQGIASIASVGSFISGITNINGLNSRVKVFSDTIGQSEQDIKTYGQAIEAAGGSFEDIFPLLEGVNKQFRDMGKNAPNIREAFAFVKEQVDALPDLASKLRLLERLNITSPGTRNLFIGDSEQFDKDLIKLEKLNWNAKQGADNARELARSWTFAQAAIGSFFTTISTVIDPVLVKLNNFLTDYFAVASKPNEAIGGIVSRLGADKFKKGLQKNTAEKKESFKYYSEPVDINESAAASDERIRKEGRIAYSIKLAQSQISTANNFPLNSVANTNNNKTVNVKTGDIHINSTAANTIDAAKQLANDFWNQLNSAYSNVDNSVGR